MVQLWLPRHVVVLTLFFVSPAAIQCPVSSVPFEDEADVDFGMGTGKSKPAKPYWKVLRLVDSDRKVNDIAALPFHNCALVGSAAEMLGKGLGAEIDAHDTVIRVNRLPTAEFEEDFGHHTDILFGNHYEATTGMVTLMREIAEASSNPKDYPATKCASNNQGDCLIAKDAVFVFTAAVTDSILSDVWHESAFQVGLQHENISNAAFNILGSVANVTGENFEPSTGLNAFLTFVPLCDRLTLYGFNGNGTADGHTQKLFHHSFDSEHVVLDESIHDTLTQTSNYQWIEEQIQRCSISLAIT